MDHTDGGVNRPESRFIKKSLALRMEWECFPFKENQQFRFYCESEGARITPTESFFAVFEIELRLASRRCCFIFNLTCCARFRPGTKFERCLSASKTTFVAAPPFTDVIFGKNFQC